MQNRREWESTIKRGAKYRQIRVKSTMDTEKHFRPDCNAVGNVCAKKGRVNQRVQKNTREKHVTIQKKGGVLLTELRGVARRKSRTEAKGGKRNRGNEAKEATRKKTRPFVPRARNRRNYIEYRANIP